MAVFATFFGLGGLAAAVGGVATIAGRSALRIDPAKRQLVKMSKCLEFKSMKVIAFDDVAGIGAISNGSVNEKPMMVLEVKSKTWKACIAAIVDMRVGGNLRIPKEWELSLCNLAEGTT